jgi:hypothetical protein
MIRVLRLILAIVAAALYLVLGIGVGTFAAMPLAGALIYLAPVNCGEICYWAFIAIMYVTIFGVAALIAFGAFKAIR